LFGLFPVRSGKGWQSLRGTGKGALKDPGCHAQGLVEQYTYEKSERTLVQQGISGRITG